MQNPFIVLKFGGTSVASASKWAEIALQAKRVLASKRRCWLAVSAVSGTTNLLEKALKEAVEDTGKDFPKDSAEEGGDAQVEDDDEGEWPGISRGS